MNLDQKRLKELRATAATMHQAPSATKVALMGRKIILELLDILEEGCTPTFTPKLPDSVPPTKPAPVPPPRQVKKKRPPVRKPKVVIRDEVA